MHSLISDLFFVHMIIFLMLTETKWEDVEQILTYGIESCMRLQTNDTPLFLADNSILSGGHRDAKSAVHEKEKV